MIFVLSGEPYQIDQFIRSTKKEKAEQGDVYESFDAQELGQDFERNVIHSLVSQNLFAKSKIIIVRFPTTLFLQHLLTYSDTIKEHTLICVMVHARRSKKESKQYMQKHFDMPKGQVLRECIVREFKVRDTNVDNQVVNSLAMIGEKAPTLYPVINEIEKVSLSPKYYREILVSQQDVHPFALTDALARKDKRNTLTLMERELQAGTKPLDMLNRILWQLRVLLLVQDAKSSPLKMHPFVIKKAQQALHFFSSQQLCEQYQEAISLYERMLFSGLPSQLLLSRFFWRL